jgi:hypothetical protein
VRFYAHLFAFFLFFAFLQTEKVHDGLAKASVSEKSGGKEFKG